MKNSVEKNVTAPVLAVFSFQSKSTSRFLNSVQHYTIKINQQNNLNLDREIIARIPDSISLMFTIEIWGGSILNSHLNNPANDIIKGKYDEVIKQLCAEFISQRPNVYFRFNPEMEVPVRLFPWQEYGSYAESFRHFVTLCKTYAPQVKQVWGPAGYPGVLEGYPGDDLVDAASVILKSDSEMYLDVYPKNYPVAYDLMRRLHRLRFIDKPIFVIGSKNNENDSLTPQVVSNISEKINAETNQIYSAENFIRPEIKTDTSPTRSIEIGLFDQFAVLNSEKPVTVEHLFVDFGSLQDGKFQKQFNEVIQRGHKIIVTFEPFCHPVNGDDPKVLQHVTEGQYDREIANLYSIIKSTNHQVYLRYAHEMEIPITRYPWQSQNPVDYIKSFRHFMTFENPLPANIKRVWGPAGDRGSLEWWPGNDVVDYISIAIYGLPDKNITDPEKQESFKTIFHRKYWRMRFVDKPIFITEFGVKGPEDYQTRWMDAAAQVIRENPQIVGINYFNMSDVPKAWGEIKPPDWSISKKTFYSFLNVLEGNSHIKK